MVFVAWKEKLLRETYRNTAFFCVFFCCCEDKRARCLPRRLIFQTSYRYELTSVGRAAVPAPDT